jgi:hypothetical protein
VVDPLVTDRQSPTGFALEQSRSERQTHAQKRPHQLIQQVLQAKLVIADRDPPEAGYSGLTRRIQRGRLSCPLQEFYFRVQIRRAPQLEPVMLYCGGSWLPRV